MMRSLPKLTCLCYAAHLVLVLHENSATVDVNDADGVPSDNAKRAAVRADYAKCKVVVFLPLRLGQKYSKADS